MKLLKLGRLLKMDNEKGHMFIKEKEVMILPAEITEELFRALSRIIGSGGASSTLYISGKELGKSFFEIFKRINGGNVLSSEDEFKVALEDFPPFIGSGKIEVLELDFKKSHLLFRGWNLPEIGLERKSDNPVCHIVRGVYTEFIELITEKHCTGKELRCQAKNDEYCEIVIDPIEI